MITIIGEALLCPHTRSGQRLMRALGMSEDAYEETDRVNLIKCVGKWTKWHRDRAWASAQCILDNVNDDDVLILLGRHVAEAFYNEYEPLTFTWIRHNVWSYMIPHPSGRWWNDRVNVLAAKGFLAGIAMNERTELRKYSKEI